LFTLPQFTGVGGFLYPPIDSFCTDKRITMSTTPRVRQGVLIGGGGAAVVEHAPTATTTAHLHSDGGLYFSDYATPQPPVVEVKQGCVFLPIFVAVWWYWTRRAARKAMRLLVAGESCQGEEQDLDISSDEQSVNESFESDMVRRPGDDHGIPVESNRDKFGTWDDVIAQENSSPHLVKWITSGQREAKRRMKIVTKTMMNRSSEPSKPSIHSDYENMENLTECDGVLSADDVFSTSGCTQWECIDDSAVEPVTTAPRESLANDAPQQNGCKPVRGGGNTKIRSPNQKNHSFVNVFSISLLLSFGLVTSLSSEQAHFRQLKITFVTGNAMKAKEMNRILADHGATRGPTPESSLVHLNVLNVDLPEIQEVDTIAIAKDKVLLATQLANGPCLVEDTSLKFHALGGMPGPYIKVRSFVSLLCDFV
jgi:hypothetical protein